jgi:hypothetical protein
MRFQFFGPPFIKYLQFPFRLEVQRGPTISKHHETHRTVGVRPGLHRCDADRRSDAVRSLDSVVVALPRLAQRA